MFKEILNSQVFFRIKNYFPCPVNGCMPNMYSLGLFFQVSDDAFLNLIQVIVFFSYRMTDIIKAVRYNGDKH